MGIQCEGQKQTHELNSIEKRISKTLIYSDIGHEEFILVIDEEQN